MTVEQNLEAIKKRIFLAAEKSRRDPNRITLVAVSKRQPIDAILRVHDLGHQDFGENLAQELATKAEELERRGRKVHWHFIGRLQRNKINKVLPVASVIQSVDSLELAEALHKRAAHPTDVLLQVNVGQEEQKGGVVPEQTLHLVEQMRGYANLKLRGLMAIPPVDADPSPYFQTMANLSQRVQQQHPDVSELSIGMSSDFETAIHYGATMVRVGTAIFGERQFEQQG